MKKAKTKLAEEDRQFLTKMAKVYAYTAFRQGPLEALHSGKPCPTCHGNRAFSHITQDEMRDLMKYAVNHMYTLLYMQTTDPYRLTFMADFTLRFFVDRWDEPELVESLLTLPMPGTT